MRSQAAATIRLDDLAALRRLNALLTTDFAQTVPRTSRDPGGQRVRAFAGSDGAIEGIVMGYVRAGRSNVEGSPRPALERVDLMLDRGRLERRAYPMIDGTRPGPATLMVSDVTAFAVRYRDNDGWRPRWDVSRADALPRAVEITITRKGQAPVLAAFLVGTPYP